MKQAKLNSARNAMAKPADDESDLEDDMDLDDEEDLEDMDDLDLDAEEEESEQEVRMPTKKASPKAPVVEDSDSDLDDQLVDDDDDSEEEEANLSALIDKAKAEKALKMQKGNDGKPIQKP